MFEVVQIVRKKRTWLVLKPVDCLLDAQHARTMSQPSFLKDSSGRSTLHFYNQKAGLKRLSTKISRTRGPRVEPVQCFIDTSSSEVEMKEMFRCREVPKIPIAPLLDIECTSIDDENTLQKDSTQNIQGGSGGIGRTVEYDKGTPLQPRKSVLKISSEVSLWLIVRAGFLFSKNFFTLQLISLIVEHWHFTLKNYHWNKPYV